MILLPAVDLRGGHVVQLVGGERDTEQVDLPDPVEVVDRWVKEGAEWIHIVDLDAAWGHKDNRGLIHDILRDKRIKAQVGGGVRTEEDLHGLLEAGARRIVVGTKALRDPLWLKAMARRYPDKIVLAIDARDGKVVAHGWQKDTGRDYIEVATSVAELPLGGLLYTAVHVEGRLQGIDRDGLKRLRSAVSLPILASGGITTLDDVTFLRDQGIDAAILGLALYLGRIRFQDAQSIAEATA